MTPLAKRVLGTVLSAAITAGVSFLAPVYQEAALALFGMAMAALHIPRPGDTKPTKVEGGRE